MEYNAAIERLRNERELEDAEIALYATTMWQGFTTNERSLVRFGMFPAEKMRAAEAALAHLQERGRRLAVALMDCAKADGGMRA